MNSFTKGNWGLKLLSILLAVVMWVYVSNDQATTTEHEFKAVPVNVRGLTGNLVVSEAPGKVTVRVQAEQNMIAKLTPRSVEAYVDLDAVKAGRSVVPVQVKVPTGVKVVDLRPPEVTVVLEPIVTKQVAVKIQATSVPAEGLKVLGMQVKPEVVVLRGRQSILNQVDEVFVEVDLQNRSQTFGESLPVRVSDTEGRLLEEAAVQRTPQSVNLLVTIGPGLLSKTVKVVPEIIGEPAKGYAVTLTSIDPADLVITGESDVISLLTEVRTNPVDVTGADKDLTVDAELMLPQGVTANRQLIRVVVKIGPE